jgi:hypothetical protein
MPSLLVDGLAMMTPPKITAIEALLTTAISIAIVVALTAVFVGAVVVITHFVVKFW